MSNLVDRAKAFALEAHKGQRRFNIAKTPMAVHIGEVASLVQLSGGSEEEIAAAWLHDVVEDTSVTLAEVAANFGASVAAIVDGLTDPPEFGGLHTRERKAAQAQRVSGESDSVKRVKMADQISNVRSVAVDPPVKWNAQKCLDYTEGARQIVFECCEVSETLFGKFGEAYWSALRAHAS